MLESFAVATIRASGRWDRESRRDLCPQSQPRKESTSITLCRFSGRNEPETRSVFDDKVYRLHLEVMTTLAQMLAKDCKMDIAKCATPAV